MYIGAKVEQAAVWHEAGWRFSVAGRLGLPGSSVPFARSVEHSFRGLRLPGSGAYSMRLAPTRSQPIGWRIEMAWRAGASCRSMTFEGDALQAAEWLEVATHQVPGPKGRRPHRQALALGPTRRVARLRT